MVDNSPTCRACNQPFDGHKSVQALCCELQAIEARASVALDGETRCVGDDHSGGYVLVAAVELERLRAENARLLATIDAAANGVCVTAELLKAAESDLAECRTLLYYDNGGMNCAERERRIGDQLSKCSREEVVARFDAELAKGADQ